MADLSARFLVDLSGGVAADDALMVDQVKPFPLTCGAESPML
jgi:hypothetical protein